jgi:hypothetical protein
MSIFPNLLRSLFLTSIFSFLTPVLLIGTILASLVLLGYVPGLEVFGQMGVTQVAQFLKVLGSTSALQGLITIGLACSVVGVLFDAYTFYRYQNLRDESVVVDYQKDSPLKDSRQDTKKGHGRPYPSRQTRSETAITSNQFGTKYLDPSGTQSPDQSRNPSSRDDHSKFQRTV